MSQPDEPGVADQPQQNLEQRLKAIPEVVPRHKRGIHWIWFLPLVAAMIGGWLAYKTMSERGPDITITFQTANGLVAGKTRIKYKAVDVGHVETIDLKKDQSGVLIGARMSHSAEPYLLEGTQFWVVRPRVSLRGVSGLDTLVAGAYIELEPGKGAAERTFQGLATPQVVFMDEPGGKFKLQAETLGSLEIGSPLYYQGLPAGEVLGYNLAEDEQNVEIHLFIRDPYHRLVRENTRFWQMSGVDFSINPDGIDVKTESLQSMWMGGIAFDTLETLNKTNKYREGEPFWLYTDKAAIADQAYTKKIMFVLYFDESVRGLSVDSPVEFRGIKVGKVTDIRMEYDLHHASFRIPVLVQIEPERFNVIHGSQPDTEDASYALMDSLVQNGLRAQLQTSSLLMGQRFVELNMHSNLPVRLRGFSDTFPELPTIPGSIGEITAAISHFVKTLQALPLQEIATELHGTLKGANKTINAPELLGTIRAMQRAAIALEKTLGHFDGQVDEFGENFTKTSDAAFRALSQTEKTLATVEGVIHPTAPLHYNMVEMTKELSSMVRSIRTFIELLESRPESLIFGKEE